MHLEQRPDKAKREQLQVALQANGLELIDNRLNQLIEKTKQLVLLKARNGVSEQEKKQKLSYYLTEKLHMDYSYLSSLCKT